MLAHIAGAPVEEAALSLAPLAAVLGSLASLRLRRLARLAPAQGRRSTPDHDGAPRSQV